MLKYEPSSEPWDRLRVSGLATFTMFARYLQDETGSRWKSLFLDKKLLEIAPATHLCADLLIAALLRLLKQIPPHGVIPAKPHIFRPEASPSNLEP